MILRRRTKRKLLVLASVVAVLFVLWIAGVGAKNGWAIQMTKCAWWAFWC